MMKKKLNPYSMPELKRVSSKDEKLKLFPFLKNIDSEEALDEIVQIIENLDKASFFL